MENNIDIVKWEKENGKLVKEMEDYHKVYKHRKPCKAWIEDRWCEHYLKARVQHFRKRINKQIGQLLELSRS